MKRQLLWASIIGLAMGCMACSEESQFADECEECIPDSVLKVALGNQDYYMPSTCGNGVVDAGEVCDGQAGLEAYSCKAIFGDGSEGTVSCAPNCLSTIKSCSAPYSCGNGARGLNENCEPDDPANWTVSSNAWVSKYTGQGYYSCSYYGSTGVRHCNDLCRWDNSDCVADSTCGNGVLDAGEQCDPNLPSSYTSVSCAENYGGGSEGYVTCSNLCMLSYANCTVPSTCGNGVLDGKEICDGVDEVVPGDETHQHSGSTWTTVNKKSCKALGSNYEGNLGCLPNCGGYDFSGCYDKTASNYVCGNGVKDPKEKCDGNDGLANYGYSCKDKGADYAGSLSCQSNCGGIDYSGCYSTLVPEYECGNGIQEPGEECDGDDGLDGLSCKLFMGSNSTGTVKCSSTCKYDVSGCSIVAGDSCGDGIRQGEEACDYAIEYPAETLACGNNMVGEKYCATNCKWNRSHCKVNPECGNGILEEGEECDPGNVNTIQQNCEDLRGLGSRGTVTCTKYCKLNYSDCSQTSCGDGIIQNGLNDTPNYHEVCDGDNVSRGTTGKKMTCRALLGVGWTGTVKCNPKCNGYDGSGCIPPADE